MERKKIGENNIEEEYYMERSFIFYLFKNPENIFYSNYYQNKKNIFFYESLSHPQSIKFLSENNFDFNTLIKKGIPYTKLSYVDKIKKFLKEEKNIINKNWNYFLSRENEMNLIDNIIKLTEFIFETKIEKGQKKPSMVLKFNKEITKKFFL